MPTEYKRTPGTSGSGGSFVKNIMGYFFLVGGGTTGESCSKASK